MALTITEHRSPTLYRRDCRKCCEETLHNAHGCIHCGTVPKPMPARSEAFVYGCAKGRPKRVDPEVTAGMKRCSRCKEIMPYSEFNRHARNPDGLAYSCRVCHRAANADHYRASKRA